ncbi:MAG: T9SS type A sorting domain-containing protein [Bacteroidetes bacterium]|jgi:streptogramin lyase|nr:T9SS type A sorting domain-containing protein [Bacteroidota bacterium]MBT5527755.1 T9SS type A sorting domain-containing protein [Cytophagia bacterium]MBT3421506.1 T9SS type A sorting domain-containing protein [Bacteroidota bacterium]MBT3935282.1 T9SS type A sorting domain-containing protein [Bacteroidota bacterium]MBT4339001.1 T9SS type A sorting domain-containing protein [Bacteroidota bacterium]
MKRIFTLGLVMIVMSISVNQVNAQCLGDTISQYTGLYGYVDAMGVSASGYVATAHMGAISLYDGVSWTNHTVTGANEVGDIAVDDNKKVYIGTHYFGFIVWENPTTYTVYDTNDGLHSMEMAGIKVAPDGKVWIGSFGGGCSYFDGTSFTKFNSTNGLADDYVVDFAFDDAGNVYIANYNGQISVYDGSGFTIITPPDVNEVNGVAYDGNGGLWVAAYSHVANSFLMHYDGTNWNSIAYPMQTYPSHIESDMSGNVWIGAWNGCFKFDGSRWKVYTTNEGLYDNQVSGLGINDFDEVWVAGSDGLSLLGEYSEVKGAVKAGGNGVWEGYAKLYKKTNSVKKYAQYDSVGLSGGNYIFTNVPVGSYIIQAVGDPAKGYEGYTGTYLGDVELWSAAKVINVAFCDTTYTNIDIDLIAKVVVPPGKGYISGHVKSADGTRAGSEPIKDVDVTLRKVPGGVVKQTKTNDNGFYDFDALGNGVYGIIIDLPGLKLDTIRTVEITDTDTTYEDQDYEVDSTGVHAGDFSSIDDYQIVSGSIVYPNPTNGLLNVHFTSSIDGPVTIELLNINGALIYQNKIDKKGDLTNQIDISDYPKGIYLLKLQGGKSMKIIKVLLK